MQEILDLLSKIYRNGNNIFFPKSTKLSRKEWKLLREYKTFFQIGSNFISLTESGIDALKSFHRQMEVM